MKLILTFAFCGLLVATVTSAGPASPRLIAPANLNPQEMAKFINSIDTTWEANEDIDPEAAPPRLGLLKSDSDPLPVKVHQIDDEPLPEQFDSRKAWPHCADLISIIRDQGECGSCWALSTVSVISDRICIHSNGTEKVQISAEDLNDCCTTCGRGCDGGFPEIALSYYVDSGLVTGGLYQSHEGCRPYSFSNCSHVVNGSLPRCSQWPPTPQCVRKCEASYPKTYKQDLHFGASSYSIGPSEQQIMTEIRKNGPVVAGFTVFDDFLTYKSGVYQKHTESADGLHAVRIIGWGVEKGVKYWQAVNSWNAEWGDGGYFKIRRGTNECGIEGYIQAAIPKLKSF